MFRKPKKKVRNKRKTFEDDTDDVVEGENSTSELIEEARKASTTTTSIGNNVNSKRVKKPKQQDNRVMHQYEAASKGRVSEKDLATRQAQHHPEEKSNKTDQETNGPGASASRGDDGIFRNKTRNKFHAGPIKSSTFVRTTCRFDYQPDVCKDYKDTGFCGFGDTCIYLHDRGDTMTGWQLEQQWEEQRKKEQTDKELKAFADGKEFNDQNNNNADVQPGDDGLPFACFLCRQPFTNPVVTSCNHYFCEKCIMDHVRQDAKNACPICNKDTHGVFNRPIKLITKKRRLVGSSASWQEFAEASKNKSTTNED